MLYSKPNVQNLAATYFSTLNEFKNYFKNVCDNSSKENIKNSNNELINKLNSNYNLPAFNDLVLRKLEFICSDISLMDKP